MALSTAAKVAALPEAERRAFYDGLSPSEMAELPHLWSFWARPDQLPPEGLGDKYRVWLMLGGRGAGKTRAAAEFIRNCVETGRYQHPGLIGSTADDVRGTMISGPSGLMTICPPGKMPEYEPSNRRIVWPSGVVARTFSAEEPSRLRGPNFDVVWLDELAAWPQDAEVWDMVMLALRLPGSSGAAPCAVITTTPRPTKLLKEIIASPSTVITRATTYDNIANLDKATLDFFRHKYEGSSKGRQELLAEIVDDVEGALFSRSLLDQTRVKAAPEGLKRVVVAIDPSGGGRDECGIVVCGRDHQGHGFVLADLSGKFSPRSWATKAVEAFRRHKADRVVAEGNFGGQMVEATLRAVAPMIPLKLVHASRGKAIRAEPIVALFEQGKAHVVGHQPALEDELSGWCPLTSSVSPGRLDAMVWGLTELLVTGARPAYRTNIDIFSR